MKKIVKRIGWFIKEERFSYAMGIAALGLIAILNLIPPKIIGNVIDSIVENTLTSEALLLYLLVFLAIGVVVYFLRYAWRMFIFGTSYRLERKMRMSLFKHFTRMSPSFYQKYRTGDLMAHATNDIRAIQRVAGGGVLQFADSILTGVSVLIAMFLSVDWKLTLLALIPMPFMIIGAQKLSKKLHEAFFDAQASFSDMNNRVHESISGIKVMKAFGQEKSDINRFGEVTDDVYNRYYRVSLIDVLFEPLFTIVIMSSYVIILWFGIRLIQQGDITTGRLSTFISYVHQLMWPMMAIGFLMNTIERGNASFDRIEKIMNEEESVLNHNKNEYQIPHGDLCFNLEHFKYPNDEHPVLKDIQFTLKQGQTLGIVGKTGSGKSTLIKLLLREYDDYQGYIELDGVNIKEYNLHALRDAVGYVPQDNFLFSMSIEDNIRFGNPETTHEEVIEAAKIADVHDDIVDFEFGYETLMGEKGISLSGGQRQRVSIARALVLKPNILILDDSLSAVDAKTEEKILSGLKYSRQNETTIISAHRLSALKHADLILVLDEGQIIERGTHASLMEAQGWYAKIFKQQEYEREEHQDGSIDN